MDSNNPTQTDSSDNPISRRDRIWNTILSLYAVLVFAVAMDIANSMAGIFDVFDPNELPTLTVICMQIQPVLWCFMGLSLLPLIIWGIKQKSRNSKRLFRLNVACVVTGSATITVLIAAMYLPILF